MDYRYKRVVSGDIDSPNNFYDYLNIMKFRSLANNQSNKIYDPYGEYATKNGIPYYPQALFFGHVYFLGEKYLFGKDNPYSNFGIGFAKLIGVEKEEENQDLSDAIPMLKEHYDFFVFEFCNSGDIIKVRPGSVIVDANNITSSAYVNHYKVPIDFKNDFEKYCPEAVSLCGVETEEKKRPKRTLFRAAFDFILLTIIMIMIFSYLEWNPVAIILLSPAFGVLFLFQYGAIRGTMDERTNSKRKEQ